MAAETKNKLGSEPGESVALASLILLEGGVECNEANISKLLEAANVKLNPIYAKVFDRAVHKGVDVMDLVNGFGKGGFSGAAAGGAPAPITDKDAKKTEAKADEEEEEESKESAAGPAGGADLFGGGGGDSDAESD